MNGVHDMGGMDGFGPVVREANEPVFHAGWERRLFAMVNLAMRAAEVNIDEFRHAIERIPPGKYLASSYYERWLAALETLLVERGVITREELLAKFDNPAEVGGAEIAIAVRNAGPDPIKEKRGAKSPRDVAPARPPRTARPPDRATCTPEHSPAARLAPSRT